MATATTTKFVRATTSATPFAMMEYKGIFARLVEAVRLAAKDFSKDPRAFVKELFLDESKDRQRKKLIRTGLILAVVFHVVFGIFLVVVKWNSNPLGKTIKEKAYEVTMVDPTVRNKPDIEKPPETDSSAQNNLSKTKQEGLGGGEHNAPPSGGGQADLKPAPLGTPPPMAKIPPIVPMNVADVPNPALPTPQTIQGNEDTPPPPPGTVLGSPTGKGTDPSGGTGKGGGVGAGDGSGVGDNKGPGAGVKGDGRPGSVGGPGGTPDGRITPTGPININRLRELPGYTNISWVHRPTPMTTPEAQANKSTGEVWIKATFQRDGTITDIDVIRDVPFMTESAVDALKRSRFRPATVNGEPVTVTGVIVRINVHY
jgi:hypothetical protein